MLVLLSLIFTIAISIAVLYLVYWLLQKYDFKVVFAVQVLLTIISNGLDGFSGFNVLSLLGSVIGSAISTAVYVWAYKRTNSFGGFLGTVLLIGVIVYFVLIVAVGSVIGSLIG